jgi:hypothetical protein
MPANQTDESDVSVADPTTAKDLADRLKPLREI